MGSPSSTVPHIDLTRDPKALEPGGPQWESTCQIIRQALESYGCFLVDHDQVSGELRGVMFEEMESMFALPKDTRLKVERLPQSTLVWPDPHTPLHEAVGVADAQAPGTVQALTELLWPDGNDRFCQATKSMSKEMGELARALTKMILHSYGLGKYWDSYLDATEDYLLMTKYPAPMTNEPTKGLGEHIDNNYITILCENDVEGLFTKSMKGEWRKVILRKNTFLVLAGFSIRAWSNGAIHACPHKVTITGDKARKSCGLFQRAKPDEIVETPTELVDDDHPLRFKPFHATEFLQYCKDRHFAMDSLDTFAGI